MNQEEKKMFQLLLTSYVLFCFNCRLQSSASSTTPALTLSNTQFTSSNYEENQEIQNNISNSSRSSWSPTSGNHQLLINITRESVQGTTLYPSIPAEEHITSISTKAPLCELKAVDPHISDSIAKKIGEDQLNLLEYNLVFPNHSVNPLTAISLYAFKLDVWARASSRHGQTLLSLAFNYGIFSLRTLTFGTDLLIVEMEDVPSGCVAGMNESEVVDQLLHLLSRDFKNTEDVELKGEERICHEIIVNVDGYAKFRDQCFKKGTGRELVETHAGNFWIDLLYALLTIVRFGIILFGPLLLTPAIAAMSKKAIPYVIKLKEPLRKKVFLAKDFDECKNIEWDKQLDFHNAKGFPRLKKAVEDLPVGKLFDAQITQYDILVSYKRLLTENRVPVGLWRSLGQVIFLCKIRNIGPFQSCCAVNMFNRCSCIKRSTPWSYLWRKVGTALLVIFVPFPWYIRLWVFYYHEYEEVMARKNATARLGLKEDFDNGLIHYLTPQHWVFSCIYVLYFVCAFILAYMGRRSEEGRFRKIITGSFDDLGNLSWIRVLETLVSNIIWPFQKYGLCGLFVAIIYWPIVLPVSLTVYVLYTLPLTYLSIRMFFYSRGVFLEKMRKRSGVWTYRDAKRTDETMRLFEASYYFGNRTNNAKQKENEEADEDGEVDPEDLDKIRSRDNIEVNSDVSFVSTGTEEVRCRFRTVEHLIASLLCILSIFSILVLMSECIGCLVEIIVFTMMGIIVNAGTLLKYVSLIILVVVYSYDSFNNVEKKYLKLNKALFNEVKGRIKDLDKVTSLPSQIQENRGFKSQELNEQGEYESPDDIMIKPRHHWMINDLVLFVDNEDMPRIPKKLFDEVCEIRVAGVPGPVYLGLLFGIRQFLKIAVFIFFVYVVVLSFGDVYKISSTNQMLATLAGGFLPVILRQFLEPERPDIEIGTVSFKSKLDEIIKRFRQVWPIYDFHLEIAKEEETSNEEVIKNDPIQGNNETTAEEEKVLTQEANTNNDKTTAKLKNDKKIDFETSKATSFVDLLILIPQWPDSVDYQPKQSNNKMDLESGQAMLGKKC